MRFFSIINHFIDVCSDTGDRSKKKKKKSLIIIDKLDNINTLSLMRLTICCYKKKEFGFQCLSPCIKDLIAHIIEIENVEENALSKDRPYDN